MQIYGHNFTSIFKNVVYFEKHRKNKTLFNVCQFKGCTLELSRYGTMDTSYISTSDSVYDPKAEKYRFKVKWNKRREFVDSKDLEKYILEKRVNYSVFRDDLVDSYIQEEGEEYLMDRIQGVDIQRENQRYREGESEDDYSEV